MLSGRRLSRRTYSAISFAVISTLTGVPAFAQTFEQNANGQAYSYLTPDSNPPYSYNYINGNYPNDNDWSQSYEQGVYTYGNPAQYFYYETAPSNWSTPYYPGAPTDPNPAGDNVDLGSNTVQLNVSVEIGSLNVGGGGALTFPGTSLDVTGDVTNNGSLTILPNNSNPYYNSFQVGGNLTNNGTITVNDSQSGTFLIIENGILSGSGSIVLNGGSLEGTLTQGAGSTISGSGSIGATTTNYGVVNANVSGTTIYIDNSPMTNANTMEATDGGTLYIGSTNYGANVTQGASGTITAGNGSTVEIVSATVTGGLITVADGGTLNLNNSNVGDMCNASTGAVQVGGGRGSTVANLVNNGSLVIQGVSSYPYSASSLEVTGDLTNNGTVTVNGGGYGASVIVQNGVLSGSGSVVLNGGSLGGMFTQGAGSTISGTGIISATMTNYSIVNANVSGGNIYINNSTVANENTLEATDSGTLYIGADTVTQGTGGAITAGNGSTVEIVSATITGGLITAGNDSMVEIANSTIMDGPITVADGGTLNLNNSNVGDMCNASTGAVQVGGGRGSTVANLVNNGSLVIQGVSSYPYSASSLEVTGDLTNNGTVTVNGGGYGASMTIENGTLSGSGSVVLNSASLGGTFTQQAGSTISGSGAISGTITNDGIINANVSGQTLYVENAITNNGLMRATNGGSLYITSGTLTNLSGTTLTGGTYEVDANSTISLPGPVATNAASIVLNGTPTNFTAINALAANSGSFTLENGASFAAGGDLGPVRK